MLAQEIREIKFITEIFTSSSQIVLRLTRMMLAGTTVRLSIFLCHFLFRLHEGRTKEKAQGRSLEKITPEEEKDVLEALKDVKEVRFKKSRDPEELIAWLDSSE
jgi:hypothetical protein